MTRPFGQHWCRDDKRLAIYHRDHFKCAYCGRTATGAGLYAKVRFTLDHIIQSDDGGTNHESNLITACLSCNAARGGAKLEHFVSKRDSKRILKQAQQPISITAGRELLARGGNFTGAMELISRCMTHTPGTGHDANTGTGHDAYTTA